MQLAETSTTVQATGIPYFPRTPVVQIATQFKKDRSRR